LLANLVGQRRVEGVSIAPESSFESVVRRRRGAINSVAVKQLREEILTPRLELKAVMSCQNIRLASPSPGSARMVGYRWKCHSLRVMPEFKSLFCVAWLADASL